MAASPSREKLRVGYLRDLKQDRCSIHILMGSKLKYTKRKISEQHKSIFQRIWLRYTTRVHSNWDTDTETEGNI